jgi:hypothetical protein
VGTLTPAFLHPEKTLAFHFFVNLKKPRTKAIGIDAKNINTGKPYFFLCGKKQALKKPDN